MKKMSVSLELAAERAKEDTPVRERSHPLDFSHPMDERRRWLLTVILFTRFTIRDLFGLAFSHHCGYFLDRQMCRKISDFGYWMDYPKGDHVLSEGTGCIVWVSISKDGRYAWTASYDRSIIRWDLLSNSMVRKWQSIGDSKPEVLAYGAGLLFSGGFDNHIHVWNAQSKDEWLRTLEGHSRGVTGLSVNSKGTELISGAYDCRIKIWCLKTWRCLRLEMTGHTELIRALSHIDGDEKIISASHDQSVRVWDRRNGTQLSKVDGIRRFANDLSVNCDASLIAVMFGRGFFVYQWPGLEMIHHIKNKVAIWGDFHPYHPGLLVVSGNGEPYPIRFWDARKGELLKTVHTGHSEMINHIAFSPDGTRVITVSEDQSVRLWDCSELASCL